MSGWLRRGSRRAALLAAPALLCAGATSPLLADGFDELLRTPAQRAAARLAAGDYRTLIEDAPDAEWEGIGRYAEGDHAGAAAAFARALDDLGADADARREHGAEHDRLRYNLATATARSGRFEEALALYDAVLASDPDHVDARRNREIVRELLALERARSSAGGDTRDSGDGAEERGGRERPAADGDEDRGENPSEDPDGARGEDADEREGEGDAEAPGADADGARDEDGDAGAPIDREAADRAARDALDAEARRGASEDPPSARTVRDAVADDITPGEREQAVEQWLRRIDDDPAGLLRRRLERTHRDDYPGVGDGEKPW